MYWIWFFSLLDLWLFGQLDWSFRMLDQVFRNWIGLSDIWMIFPSEKLTFHLARRLLKLYGFLFILKSFKTRYRIALTAMIKELFNHIY
jgi:hypothetical protein